MTTPAPDLSPAGDAKERPQRALITTTVSGMAPGSFGYLRTRKSAVFRDEDLLAVRAEAIFEPFDDGTGTPSHRIDRRQDGTYAIVLVTTAGSAPRRSADSVAARRDRGESVVVFDAVTEASPIAHLTRSFIDSACDGNLGAATTAYTRGLIRLTKQVLRQY